jgi:solute carrier family 34 (sodium-dependent phosphate cotransporter)
VTALDPASGRLSRLGEDAAGALVANEEARAAGGRPRQPALAVLRGAGGVAVALYLFVVALKLLSASAPGVAGLLVRLAAEGPVNMLGFGWLAAYGALSGSPVAALALSLLDGGAIDQSGALGMLAGSRMGASFVVLLVGFAAYLRGRGRPDGVYVGVVSLLTTITTYAPATLLALWLLGTGWLDRPAGAIPTGWADLPAALASPVVGWMEAHAAGVVLFGAGVGALLGAFWVFDRVLPSLDPPSPRFERLARRFGSPRSMFLFGALITSMTMSVSLSVTILVPLTLKGIVRRHTVIPYIMGANITTFLDTLFAALLLDAQTAAPVVLAEMLAVAAVSLLVLMLAYERYASLILGAAHAVTSDRRWLAGFLAALAGVPLVLLLL